MEDLIGGVTEAVNSFDLSREDAQVCRLLYTVFCSWGLYFSLPSRVRADPGHQTHFGQYHGTKHI